MSILNSVFREATESSNSLFWHIVVIMRYMFYP